jgi:hypothetical protein
MMHTNASLLFPSVHLYPLVSGSREPLERVYLRHHHPRVRGRAPGDGVEPESQVMIAPEPSERDPADPAIALFETRPLWAAARRDPANQCERFDFLDARRHLDLQFAHNGEAGAVTVCVVRRPPVEPAPTIEVGR